MKAIDAGAHCIRLNPGNIGGPDKVAQVVEKRADRRDATADRRQLRLVAAHLRELEYTNPVEALVAAALGFVELMESLKFDNFKVSMKSTSRAEHDRVEPPAGLEDPVPAASGDHRGRDQVEGSLKSAVGLGTLLADGIGDTIRISLSTFHAEEEVKVAWEILKALKLRERGPVLIACPTCGRLQFDMDTVVSEVEERLAAYEDPIEVSMLGCAVNGIGEARHADFGITGAKDAGMIYSRGEPLKKVPTEHLVDELFIEIDKWYAAGKKIVVDEAAAAEARQWLSENEDDTAVTPERLAAAEAEQAKKEAEAAAKAEQAAKRESESPTAGRRFTRA